MKESRINILDGLRAVAVVAVVLQHILEFFPILAKEGSGQLGRFLHDNLNFGRFGVILFFLISGYLVPFTLRNVPNAVISFWVSRLFRLYPLYWISLIVAVFILIFLLPTKPLMTFEIFVNFTMLQMFFGVDNILEPYWTLFVELVFYILCTVFFVFKSTQERQAFLFTIFSSAVILSCSLIIFLFPGFHIGAFGKIATFISYLAIMNIGILFRILDENNSGWRNIFFVIIGFIFVILLYAMVRSPVVNDGLLSPYSVFFSTLFAIFFFLIRRKLHMILTNVISLFLGKISYGIYLFHPIFLHVSVYLLPQKNTAVDFLLMVIAVMLPTIALAYAGKIIIEDPFIEIGKRIRKSLNTKMDGKAVA